MSLGLVLIFALLGTSLTGFGQSLFSLHSFLIQDQTTALCALLALAVPFLLWGWRFLTPEAGEPVDRASATFFCKTSGTNPFPVVWRHGSAEPTYSE